MVSSSSPSESHHAALDSLVDEVRDFIDRVHRPRIKDARWIELAHHKGHDIAERMAAYASAASGRQTAAYESMKALAERVSACADELVGGPNVQALVEQKEKLGRSYEEFLLDLKKRRIARAAALSRSWQLKPVNYARNVFHAATGLTGVLMYWLVLTRPQALMVLGAIFVVFGTFEVTRLFSTRWNDFLCDKLFGAISRPSERYRVNSATVYLLALIIIVAIFPKLAVLGAVVVLAIGDPLASLIGKRFGRRKLFRDKSYVGTLAFFVTGLLAASLLLGLAGPDLGLGRIAFAAGVMAAVGAATELFSSRIDDNFSVPLACAAAGALVLGS